MNKLLLIFVVIILFPSCEPECNVSSSCIPPPEGAFQSGEINVAVFESILEEFEPNSYQSVGTLDSIIIYTSLNNLTVIDFYRWESITNESSITSIDIFYEEKMEKLELGDFMFDETESTFIDGGYLFTVIKSASETKLKVQKASQDLIDGVCNDTIDC